jgi:tRNA (adenine57-N1/adenine58-N1)-methyltransferase
MTLATTPEKVRLVLLVQERNKQFLIKSKENDFHSQFGVIKKEALSTAKPGDRLKTNTGMEMVVLAPTYHDLFRKIKRNAQIIPAKDIGAIISHTGLHRDSVVLDVGAGSGGLTLHLAKIAQEVHACDIRDDHLAIVKQNAEFLGLSNIIFKKLDIYTQESIQEIDTTFDIICLDLPEPWKSIPQAMQILKTGGIIASYSPCITQTMELVETVLSQEELYHLETIDATETEWVVHHKRVRPKTQSIDHSGFLTFIRKIA